jgi:hypothetical protein
MVFSYPMFTLEIFLLTSGKRRGYWIFPVEILMRLPVFAGTPS